MHIGEVLNGVYDDDIGWRPASGSVKPVHVANGLVRAIQGKYFDVRSLNHFVVWWRAGKLTDDRRAFDGLVQTDESGSYGYLISSHQEFERTRRYALGILGADQALFPSAENSSFSLTCGQMATRDSNDRGLGAFAAFLIRGDGDRRSLADEVLRCVDTDRPLDPVTTLVWPLLPKEGTDTSQPRKLTKVSKQAHNRDIFAALREAAACLASHEREQGNRLRTLQRAVQFACVATHAHAQALSGDGSLNMRPPALVALAGARRGDVALASERSLELIYRQFEKWLGDRLGRRLKSGLALTSGEEPVSIDTTDGRSVRALLRRIGVAKNPHGEPGKEDLDTRCQIFATKAREFGSEDPALVLGHTLVHCYAREYESGGPKAFLQGLGRKIGLLYPHFQGRSREKRVRPSVPLVDMLVRSCVPSGEAIELDELLSRLWYRFGLIVGGRRSSEWDDAAYLELAGIPVDIDELAANTESFVDELALMGLARRYPDGVTFVGEGYAG